METAKRAADVYRSQGASEEEANRQVYGTTTPGPSDWARINQGYKKSGSSGSGGSGGGGGGGGGSGGGGGGVTGTAGNVSVQSDRGLTESDVRTILADYLDRLQPQVDLDELFRRWSEQQRQYSLPYEQALRDLMASFPQYRQPTEAELRQQAEQYAELYFTPQQQALQRALEQIATSAQQQQRTIEAAYQGVPEQLAKAAEEARKAALESAIARGAGRSGVVDWQSAKIGEQQQQQLSQAEAAKAAAIANLMQQRGLSEQQINEQLQQLSERRGDLISQYINQLQNQGYARSAEDWQRQFQAAAQIANMALGANQFNQQFAASLLPYFAMTEYQRNLLPTEWTGTVGTVPQAPGAGVQQYQPASMSASPEQVAIRQYVQQLGGNVWYDPATGEVVINGRRFRPQDVGGYIRGGTAYAPQTYINQLLGVA